MAQSANYSPDYSYDDNRAHALVLHDLDLAASLVSAQANVMKEAREATPADHVARVEGLYRRPDRERETRMGFSAILNAASNTTGTRPKPLSKMTKRERAEHDARLAVRRAALEELKADSARLQAEKQARKGGRGAVRSRTTRSTTGA